jgi:hypothetical protein
MELCGKGSELAHRLLPITFRHGHKMMGRTDIDACGIGFDVLQMLGQSFAFTGALGRLALGFA